MMRCGSSVAARFAIPRYARAYLDVFVGERYTATPEAKDTARPSLQEASRSGGMADTLRSGRSGGNPVEVQILSSAQNGYSI